MKTELAGEAVDYFVTTLGYDVKDVIRIMHRDIGPLEPTSVITEEQHVTILAALVMETLAE